MWRDIGVSTHFTTYESRYTFEDHAEPSGFTKQSQNPIHLELSVKQVHIAPEYDPSLFPSLNRRIDPAILLHHTIRPEDYKPLAFPLLKILTLIVLAFRIGYCAFGLRHVYKSSKRTSRKNNIRLMTHKAPNAMDTPDLADLETHLNYKDAMSVRTSSIGSSLSSFGLERYLATHAVESMLDIDASTLKEYPWYLHSSGRHWIWESASLDQENSMVSASFGSDSPFSSHIFIHWIFMWSQAYQLSPLPARILNRLVPNFPFRFLLRPLMLRPTSDFPKRYYVSHLRASERCTSPHGSSENMELGSVANARGLNSNIHMRGSRAENSFPQLTRTPMVVSFLQRTGRVFWNLDGGSLGMENSTSTGLEED